MSSTGNSESGFHFYCYGVVAADKPEDTNIIEAFPKDLMYNLSGEVNNKQESVIINRESTDGKVKTDKISATSTIPARWLALGGSNRVSAPDVRKGETVLIFRYGTNDDYYWEPITTELSKRGKETVTYLFKNSDGQDPIAPDGSNAYYLTYSTRHKFVHLHTSNNDGEAVAFDIKLDTKNGTINISDSRANSITLNSPEDKLNVKTNNEFNLETASKVNVLTKDCTVQCDNFTIKSKKTSINP